MILPAIARRRSIRSYTADNVSDDMLFELVKAAQFAPTSRNNRSTHFVLVRDKAAKEHLAEILQSPDLIPAPAVIVPVTDPSKSSNAMQDLSLASQNIFLQATEMGLGTVWKNVRKEQTRAAILSLLGIPSTYLLINVIPVGHPAEHPEAYGEKDFDPSRIHRERW